MALPVTSCAPALRQAMYTDDRKLDVLLVGCCGFFGRRVLKRLLETLDGTAYRQGPLLKPGQQQQAPADSSLAVLRIN